MHTCHMHARKLFLVELTRPLRMALVNSLVPAAATSESWRKLLCRPSLYMGLEYRDYPAPTHRLCFQNSIPKTRVFVHILYYKLVFKGKS